MDPCRLRKKMAMHMYMYIPLLVVMFALRMISFHISNKPGHEKTCLMSYANNKGADQPARPRSLISAFVVRCLDSIIALDPISEISGL